MWGVCEGYNGICASQAPQPEEKSLFLLPGRVAARNDSGIPQSLKLINRVIKYIDFDPQKARVFTYNT